MESGGAAGPALAANPTRAALLPSAEVPAPTALPPLASELSAKISNQRPISRPSRQSAAHMRNGWVLELID
jgi:hypothetical protein